MPANRQFNIIGLIFSIVIIGLFVTLVIYISRDQRSGPTRYGAYVRPLRGLHESMIVFAANNNGYYPGLDASGELVQHNFTIGPKQPAQHGYDQPAHPAYRIRLMLEQKLFTGELLVNVAETKKRWSAGPLTTENYSHALLNLPDNGGRLDEWKTTNNSAAPVVSDRAIRTSESKNIVGLLSESGNNSPWRGCLVWNDNHATLDDFYTVDTRYSNISNTNDNLFTATSNNDAAMAYGGVDDYVDGD